MKANFSRIVTPVILGVTLALGACKQGDRPEDALAQDTSLAHDLQLANSDTTAQPALTDVPATVIPAETPTAEKPKVARRQTPSEILTPRRNPTPVATTPRPAEPAPEVTANGNTVSENKSGGSSEGTVGTIATGSEISLYSGQRVCTNQYQVGDKFTASVAESVQGTNGVSIPAGATAVIEITGLKRSENANDNIQMEFAVRSILGSLQTHGRYQPFSWAFGARVGDQMIEGEIVAEPADVIGLTYTDTDGGSKYCYNSAIATCRIQLAGTAFERTELTATRRAMLEILTDTRHDQVPLLA